MELRERMNKLKEKQKGFTLVELIVVIAIIGILAGVMLPRYFGFTDDAREAAAIAEARSIRAIAETYYAGSNNGTWSTIDNVTGGFKVQTGGDSTTPDYANSPTFKGTISLTSGGSQLSDGDEITNGEFYYTLNGHEAHCDQDGHVE